MPTPRAHDANSDRLDPPQGGFAPLLFQVDARRVSNSVQKRARLGDKEPALGGTKEGSIVGWLETQRNTASEIERALIDGRWMPGDDSAERTPLFFGMNRQARMRASGDATLTFDVNSGDMGGSYISNTMQIFGPCGDVRITHNYESEHVETIARALDSETDAEPLVPRYTKNFKLTVAQRMQVAHISGAVASSKQRCLSVHLDAAALNEIYQSESGRRIRRNLTVSRSVRGDGGPQKMQLLVAGPGTGKTIMALATAATILCGRNYAAFGENAERDLMQSPGVCVMHPHAKMMRVALIVCPPRLIDYWKNTAASMFDGVDCADGGSFRATLDGALEGRWVVKVVNDVRTVRGMLDRPGTGRDAEIWLVAGYSSSSSVLECIFKHELHYPAMVIYDEGRFAFPASRAVSGCGYEAVPFTLVLTATPAELATNMSSNTRHPLRTAMERGGCSGWRFHDNAIVMRANLAYGQLGPAAASICRCLLLRLASGPPELFLNCRNTALSSMPAGMTVFRMEHHTLVNVSSRLRHSVDRRPEGSRISVLSTWSALRNHGNTIRNTTRTSMTGHATIRSLVEGFLNRLDELEAEHKALGSHVVDLEWLHANLRPSVTEIEKQLETSFFQSGVSEGVSRLRNMLEAALTIARLGDSCGVCLEPLAESRERVGAVCAGLTNCCGHVLCFTCLPKLPKPVCPFCRSTNFGDFSVVGEDPVATAATTPPPDIYVSELRTTSLDYALNRNEHVIADGTMLGELTSLFRVEPGETDRRGLDDAPFLRFCTSIRNANVSAFEAVRCSAFLACASRGAVAARVPVFFDFLSAASTFAVEACIKSSVPEAVVFNMEDFSSPHQIPGVSRHPLEAFADESSARPVFLLCDTGSRSTSIAGSDLGNSTAAIVAGTMCADHETQLLGRFMRMSKEHNRPKIRVFHLCQSYRD